MCVCMSFPMYVSMRPVCEGEVSVSVVFVCICNLSRDRQERHHSWSTARADCLGDDHFSRKCVSAMFVGEAVYGNMM